MNVNIHIALIGWIPVILALFALLPARQAAIVGFLGAWLFLPPGVGYDIPGLPNYNKVTATSVGIMAATAIFDLNRLASLRLSWLDLPMAVWCLCPYASSLDNGLGAYDGMATAFENVVIWGIPYYLGRIYLQTPDDFQWFAKAVFVGGLVYLPFCLFEIRMSPRLARDVYTLYTSRGIEYRNELGAWGSRPNVFMGNALAVGLFMTSASLAGLWLWKSRALQKLGPYRTGWIVAALIVVSLMCKNLGALTLLAAGSAVLFMAARMQRALPLYLLASLAPLYIVARTTGDWSGENLTSLASMVNERRGESLEFRLRNEDILIDKALQRPLFGWGGWGRARVYREDGADISVTDGLWIIALGNTGLFGLSALMTALLLPCVAFARRFPARAWISPQCAPLAVGAILGITFAIDSLFNAFPNPLYVVANGGLITLCGSALPIGQRVYVVRRRARPAARLGRPGLEPVEGQTP